jgi:hypothetical protein
LPLSLKSVFCTRPQRDLQEAFAQGWRIESIEPVQLAVRPDLEGMRFSPGGPKAWFATVRRE